MILGIDPGATGALALFEPATGYLDVRDIPTHKVKEGGSLKTRIDLYQLATLMDDWAAFGIHQAVIEDVRPMPKSKQGITSTFFFGKSAGVVEMAVAAHLIPMRLVRPATWKKQMRLSSNKDESRRRASELMPAHARHWALKKHDGRAEAALLAYWGAVQ